jgi:hypothetical protein
MLLLLPPPPLLLLLLLLFTLIPLACYRNKEAAATYMRSPTCIVCNDHGPRCQVWFSRLEVLQRLFGESIQQQQVNGATCG